MPRVLVVGAGERELVDAHQEARRAGGRLAQNGLGGQPPSGCRLRRSKAYAPRFMPSRWRMRTGRGGTGRLATAAVTSGRSRALSSTRPARSSSANRSRALRCQSLILAPSRMSHFTSKGSAGAGEHTRRLLVYARAGQRACRPHLRDRARACRRRAGRPAAHALRRRVEPDPAYQAVDGLAPARRFELARRPRAASRGRARARAGYPGPSRAACHPSWRPRPRPSPTAARRA